MSINDIIKSSIVEKFAGESMILSQVILVLIVSCCIGIYIYIVYRNFSKSAFYSKDFNITLTGMTIIVAAIMIAMQSNLIVSMGMVGALSIVRFRTAIKNPLDLLYLFWSISAGIICGVGLYLLSVCVCVIMTIAIWVLGRMPKAKAPAILIIRGSKVLDQEAMMQIVKAQCNYCKLSSVSVKNDQKECIIELYSAHIPKIVDIISENCHVKSVNWMEHDGELRA